MQSKKDFTLIEGPDNYKSGNDFFAYKIVGESMNRVIPNGSTFPFKPYNGRSRNVKIANGQKYKQAGNSVPVNVVK